MNSILCLVKPFSVWKDQKRDPIIFNCFFFLFSGFFKKEDLMQIFFLRLVNLRTVNTLDTSLNSHSGNSSNN